MTNIPAIYSLANRSLTVGCARRWFVWVSSRVAMVNTHSVPRWKIVLLDRVVDCHVQKVGMFRYSGYNGTKYVTR